MSMDRRVMTFFCALASAIYLHRELGAAQFELNAICATAVSAVLQPELSGTSARLRQPWHVCEAQTEESTRER